MRQVTFPSGQTVPALGQGTWRMGEDAARARDEAAALLAGIEAGMTVIDTAEMYGDGATERFLGTALAGHRDASFLVSKAYPHHASRQSLPRACEASLRRLRTDHLDLYLLHWPGSVPLDETVEAMEALVNAGKIKAWGVSNFDTEDMEALLRAGGGSCATNQILYNLQRRGPEFDLIPWMDRHAMPVMAYSPIEQGRLPRGGILADVARRHGVASTQIALAFAMRNGALAIPKAATLAHVRDNRRAAEITLTAEDLADLDTAFPPPARKRRLEML